MRAAWGFIVAAALAPAVWSQASPQAPSSPVFQVDFSNPGLVPSHWTLTLDPDGNGHFRSEHGPAATQVAGLEPFAGIQAPDLDREIRVSADFAAHVFHTARQHRFFVSGCESHQKVAFQGWKKLSYRGPDGEGNCEFNYSKDKEIQALGDSLVAVAGTILEGARLETLLQHDRLGLDHEIEYLTEAAGDGRVQQIVTIKGILERLAEDPTVMERVRKRAKALLARANT
jgi:hypothetical protein